MTIDRKKNIVEAARKSFALFGYKATTMDQVASIANVGKGTIYTFFKNKEELFDEILHSVLLEMKQIAEEAIQPELSFFENLHRALYRVLDFRRNHELIIKMTHEVRDIGTPAAQAALNKVESVILSFIKKMIKKGIERNEIKPCDPEITAFVMFKLYLALVFEWERHHAPLENREIADLFQLYLVEGLAVK